MSATSGSCGWYTMQSKVSPIRSRQASPLRNSALASIPAELARAVVISGLASHAAVQRIPRKRPFPASASASSTGSTRSPQHQVGVAHDGGGNDSLVANVTLSLSKGVGCGYSFDELDLAHRPQFLGPWVRYCEWHSTNTVWFTRCPERVSASRFSSR